MLIGFIQQPATSPMTGASVEESNVSCSLSASSLALPCIMMIYFYFNHDGQHKSIDDHRL
jgi:hypothetical protein